jgi:hypothetical protein
MLKGKFIDMSTYIRKSEISDKESNDAFQILRKRRASHLKKVRQDHKNRAEINEL